MKKKQPTERKKEEKNKAPEFDNRQGYLIEEN